ncbi:MAG: DUF6020 family protein [Eubacteriales bacterium]
MKFIKEEKIILWILIIVSAYLEVYTFDYVYLESLELIRGGTISTLLFIFFIVISYTMSEIKDRGVVCWGIVFGILTASVMIVGNKLMMVNNISSIFSSFKSILLYFLLFCGYFILSTELFSIMFCAIKRNKVYIVKQSNRNMHGKKKWYFLWLIMAVSYLPCYLSYFPGIMSYDSGWITRQALGILSYDNFQPFLHTIFWTAFVKFELWTGIDTIGLILYSITQILILTSIFTYVVYRLYEMGFHIIYCVIAYLFYALSPIMALFSFVVTKDVLFTGIFLLFSLYLLDCSRDISAFFICKKKMFSFAIITVCACLFRNNMIYVIIVYAFIFILCCKTVRKQATILFGIVILTYYFVVGGVYTVIGVQDGNIREMLSVPISQLANVYINYDDVLTLEQKELINVYIPDVLEYDPQIADDIKAAFASQLFEENPKEFIFLWWQVLLKKPLVYVETFLALNLPYWYPEMGSVRTYIETQHVSSYYDVSRTEALPQINRFYEVFAMYRLDFIYMPIMQQLFAISTPIWLLLISVVCFIIKKRYQYIWVVLPSILLWLTYLLGPVSNLRYVLPLMALYPILVGLMFYKEGVRRN